MRVEIVGRGVEVDADLRTLIERRLAFALDRVEGRVSRVSVYLTDINGPRGGPDKRCRIVADMPGIGQGQVVVEDVSGNVPALVDRSAERLGQAIRRRIERERIHDRLRAGLALR